MLKLAVLPLMFVALLGQAPPKGHAKPAKPINFKKKISPFLVKYCNDCHSGAKAAAQIDLTKFKTQADVDAKKMVWRKAGKEVHQNMMPPADHKQPTAAEKKMFVDYCAKVGG